MSEPTTPAPVAHKIGDLVTPDPAAYGPGVRGKVYEIVKVPRTAREVNYTARPQGDPNGRGIKGPAWALLPHDPATTTTTATGVTMVPIPVYVPTPEAGTLVRVTGVPKINPTDLYVVQGDARNAAAAVKIVKLGGEGGRYWPKIPVARLTVIPVSALTVGDLDEPATV